MKGFVDTGLDLVNDDAAQSGGVRYSLHGKVYPKGRVKLGPNAAGGAVLEDAGRERSAGPKQASSQL